MKDYVVCENKGNRPRIHVKICWHRCKKSEGCKVFQEYMKARAADEMVISSSAEVLPPEKNILWTAT
ncbi:MAG: hypothetical protein HWN68_07215 [Desulfobacterales bacterium]|nr:hypothetical protein [Desulfobacterales bacterium]